MDMNNKCILASDRQFSGKLDRSTKST